MKEWIVSLVGWILDLLTRYLHRSKHTVRAVSRAGRNAIRADLLTLQVFNERVKCATLSRETAEWETVASRKLRRQLAALGV